MQIKSHDSRGDTIDSSFAATHPWPLNFIRFPSEYPAVYEMTPRDTIGVLPNPNLAPNDNAAALATAVFLTICHRSSIVRPGPDPGRHVHPLSAPRMVRRVSYPNKDVSACSPKRWCPLSRTGKSLAIVASGFTRGEADHSPRHRGGKTKGNQFANSLAPMNGMIERGLRPAIPTAASSRSKAFPSYGFPESHPRASRCWYSVIVAESIIPAEFPRAHQHPPRAFTRRPIRPRSQSMA
jgi:hypothetical protein